ncbi:MAG: DEAD/DEAH box helicase [Hyphomicrobium sp.]|jgi:hypothetical protein
MISIHVGDRWTRLEGLHGTALIDVVSAAPEPPFEIKDYMKTVPQNLLYLEQWAVARDVQWCDPQNRLFEAKGMRFLGALRSGGPTKYDFEFPFKTKPDDYQLEFFAHARTLTNIALCPAALGVGKTMMLLNVAADKFLRGDIDGVAIIAPNGVHRQWVTKGVPVHLSDAVPRLAHVWSPSRKMPKDFALIENDPIKRLRILTFNVEAFSTATGKARKTLANLMSRSRWMLIVDESQRAKNPRAERTKQIDKVARLAVARAICTATPVTKNFTDFYSQYHILDERIIGLSNFIAFRNRYCITIPVPGAPRGAVKIVGHRNVEELFRRIAPVTFMIPASVLNLKEPWREQVEVALTDEQRDVYGMLAEKMVFDLKEQNIESPSNALTHLLRLQQVLCGRVYEEGVDEDGVEIAVPRVIPNNRPAALIQFLEEYDGAAVVWARFQQDIDDIGRALDDRARKAGRSESDPSTWRYTTYDGRVTQVAEREARVAAFARGNVDYFLGNPAAGGTGVDGLQDSCALAVYYSNSFNREIRWQSEGRIQRRGQKSHVGLVDLVSPNTVDQLFLEAFASAEELVNMVMRSPEILTRGL